MRKCRKCKINYVEESKKWCEECKIAPQTCECGCVFKSKKHDFCKSCRNTKGNDGICAVCHKKRHIYYDTNVCTTCYRFTHKYQININELIDLRKIDKCQLCGIEVSHHIGNGNGRAVIDHDHQTNKVRGVLCVHCNLIEGMIRDKQHLDSFYQNYLSYLEKET
jgi:hypothetical protein